MASNANFNQQASPDRQWLGVVDEATQQVASSLSSPSELQVSIDRSHLVAFANDSLQVVDHKTGVSQTAGPDDSLYLPSRARCTTMLDGTKVIGRVHASGYVSYGEAIREAASPFKTALLASMAVGLWLSAGNTGLYDPAADLPSATDPYTKARFQAAYQDRQIMENARTRMMEHGFDHVGYPLAA